MKLGLNNIINTKVLLVTFSLVIFFRYILEDSIENDIVIKI